ncbi:hypothetical protein [Schinkia azotoformans]|uniref:hypothetical protein n=1 Tax=Schinkia azotoformans TaxID=1454 RepID=UPI002DB5A6DE|nr:hypothetical protein [Schinkia azotoformans]MEC1714702.1 hypothetical protein [Schinkia azotoformans]MEC1757542.1 hypothetical protein [Schinkia azotoformans]
MGIFDFLFNSKQKNAHQEPKSPREEIEISEWDDENYYISLDVYDYRGKAYYSPNKKYMASGDKKRVALVDAEHKSVLFVYDIFKNVDFTSIQVTDHPYVLVRDIIGLADNRGNDFYVLNKHSDIVFKSNINAHIHSMGISEDCKYAAVQIGSECEIIVYDIEHQKQIRKWIPVTRLCTGIKIDSSNMIIALTKFDEEYKYTFNGDFLDQQKWYEYRKNCSIPSLQLDVAYESIDFLFEIQSDKQLISDYYEAFSIINSALENGVNPKEKAQAYRKIGEVYDKFSEYENALENYKMAISFDEKVGVKGRINVLEKATK